MPLFEYRCDACHHLEEVLQKHGEPPPEACPACQAVGVMQKAISLTSFHLKGGGWYKDLYSSASGASGTSSSSADGSGSTAAGSTSSGSDASSGSASTSSAAATSTPAPAPAAAPATSSTAKASEAA